MNVFAFMIGAALIIGSTAHSYAQDRSRSINQTMMGCTDWDTYKRLTNFVAQGDREAYSKVATRALINGTCKDIERGTPVFIDETAFLSASICVRPRGEAQCYWIPMELVD